MRALLALEDGRVFTGRSFTGHVETVGEVVFNTSMTGYQEILTDPSYCGQIVTLTYPMIGNYGVNDEDIESERIQVNALLVKEYQAHPSNWRSKGTLSDYLIKNNIPGIEGIDTRAVTRHIRLAGAMKGALSTRNPDPESLIKTAVNSPNMIGRDLVKEVTCNEPVLWTSSGAEALHAHLSTFQWNTSAGKWRIVALDYGAKYGILRSLAKRNCDILLLPAKTETETIDRLNPDGLLLSNGPGDPAAVTYAIETVKAQLGKRPIFGICLGHQIIAHALGGKTYKLKFGHRGGNQPVKELKTGNVEVTSQNHGFCVDMESLNHVNIALTHINLNDQTLEGLMHNDMPLFSVQYHPEASPGPHDASYLFNRFIEMLEKHHARKC